MVKNFELLCTHVHGIICFLSRYKPISPVPLYRHQCETIHVPMNSVYMMRQYHTDYEIDLTQKKLIEDNLIDVYSKTCLIRHLFIPFPGLRYLAMIFIHI